MSKLSSSYLHPAHDSDGREPSTVIIVWVDDQPSIFDGTALTYAPQMLTESRRAPNGVAVPAAG
jgi:hypothetical protein